MSDYKNQIEAILFASGRLMDINTLMNLTEASSKQVLRKNISKLKEEYEARDSPLLIIEERDGWKLTVREKYLPIVRSIVSDMELPKSILETLSVIAWKAPVLQSDVVKIRHNKAYEHIAELEDLGFITKEPDGRSYVVKLTEKFFTYFDIEGTHDIKEFLKRSKVPEIDIPEVNEDEVNPTQPTILVYGDDNPVENSPEKSEEEVLYPDDGREHLGALEIYEQPPVRDIPKVSNSVGISKVPIPLPEKTEEEMLRSAKEQAESILKEFGDESEVEASDSTSDEMGVLRQPEIVDSGNAPSEDDPLDKTISESGDGAKIPDDNPSGLEDDPHDEAVAEDLFGTQSKEPKDKSE